MYRLIAKLVPGSMWKHTKSDATIRVLHVGRIEASQELCVVYQHGPNTDVWVRPLSEWLSLVDMTPVTRFQPVEP